jgi:hypothetical protein
MHAVHQDCVPKEAKHEEKDERRDESDEEFLLIHNFFLLSFAVVRFEPACFMAGCRRISI